MIKKISTIGAVDNYNFSQRTEKKNANNGLDAYQQTRHFSSGRTAFPPAGGVDKSATYHDKPRETAALGK